LTLASLSESNTRRGRGPAAAAGHSTIERPEKGIAMAKYLEGTDQQKRRAYSPAVVTEGGRIVWLAGQTATVDGDGNDISGNFEAQTHRVFALIDQTLQRVGGTLANLVTMTVFIKEPRYGDRFVELRAQKFAAGNFPGSALITVTNFARPGMEIEIQAVAVIGDRA
jgi:2-iminobutanoate/2-iminopropanoate deaminase